MLIIKRSNLRYTASGIITPIGGRLVHRKTLYTAFKCFPYVCVSEQVRDLAYL